MAIEEQRALADRLDVWLVLQNKGGAEFGDMLGSVALVLGDMLGSAAASGHDLDAEVLRMVLEQRFATMEAMVPDEEEGFDLGEEEEEEEGDHIEGEEEGDEGFGV
jgi:hypothetical protein